jgi:hypothetical protein
MALRGLFPDEDVGKHVVPPDCKINHAPRMLRRMARELQIRHLLTVGGGRGR